MFCSSAYYFRVPLLLSCANCYVQEYLIAFMIDVDTKWSWFMNKFGWFWIIIIMCRCWKSAAEASLTARQAVRDRVIEYCRAKPLNAPRNCRATPYVTATQRSTWRPRNAPRDCRATPHVTAAQRPRNAPRDCRATPHVTACNAPREDRKSVV